MKLVLLGLMVCNKFDSDAVLFDGPTVQVSPTNIAQNYILFPNGMLTPGT